MNEIKKRKENDNRKYTENCSTIHANRINDAVPSNQQLAQSQKTATIHPSYSSRCRPRAEEDPRFAYGRYRHSTTTNRLPSHSPHAFGHHAHHSHAHGHATHGPHSSHHSSHTHLHQDDDGIYESADRSVVEARLDPREPPDSESVNFYVPSSSSPSSLSPSTPSHTSFIHPSISIYVPDHTNHLLYACKLQHPNAPSPSFNKSDDFIQAQQLARWASEDVVSVVVLDQQAGTTSDSQQSNGGGITSAASTGTVIHHQHPHQHHGDHQSSAVATSSAGVLISTNTNQQHPIALGNMPNGISVNQRDYYPSPPSTETESSGSVIQPLNRRYTIQADTGQQQLQLHQLHQHQHQHQHQTVAGDTTSSSNNSQSGQILENGRYPEYKH
uniref:Uncharacterized protein n=1 Tax=Glossina palpalis gambiensis TaxID=67801 RepID=A0A1B0AKZ8_9MUSC